MADKILSSTRIQQDTLITKSIGTFITQSGTGLDCSNAGIVNDFIVAASEPAGTGIYFAFNTGSSWFKLNGGDAAPSFSVSDPDFDAIKTNGNSLSEIRALSDIRAFVGKIVRVAIAMEGTDITTARPTLSRFGVNYVSIDQQTTITQLSPSYDLGSGAQIASCISDTSSTGEANAEVTAMITYEDGSQSEWLPLVSLSGVKASSIKFKGTYNVNNIGMESSKIKSTSVIYSDGNTPITGQEDTELYSVTQDWYMNISQCRLTVKHSHLITSDIKAYVALREAPTIIQGEIIGSGTNSRSTFQLAHTNGINYDTIRLYYDGARIYTGYEVNTEVGRITCEAPEGVIITCDYEYGWELETWHQMILSSRENLLDYDQSEYRFGIDDNTKSVCGLRLVLHTEMGHTDGLELGRATGSIQTAKLPYSISDGVITIYENGAELDGHNWEILDDPQYIRYTAQEGRTITIDYDWYSETPIVYQFAGVFSE